MNFNFFNMFKENENNETGAAANIDPSSLADADFSDDNDFFVDIESWGERIAIK